MKRLTRWLWLGALVGLWFGAGPACEKLGGSFGGASVPKAPVRVQAPGSKGTPPAAMKSGSMYEAVAHGLWLINAGNFGGWMSRFCHPQQCTTSNARQALRRYNLRALQRRSKDCLRGKNKLTIKVTRIDKYPDGSRKIFVKCNPKGSPYPIRVKKDKADKDKWKWVTA